MTTLTAPIAKLYKRCARKHHDDCPGHFDYSNGQVYSVCSCDCHAGVSDTRPAPVTCEDKAEAVAEAQAIVTPVRVPQISNADTAKMLGTTPLGAKPTPPGKRNAKGGLTVPRGSYKCYNPKNPATFWADAKHPSGPDKVVPTDWRIFQPGTYKKGA